METTGESQKMVLPLILPHGHNISIRLYADDTLIYLCCHTTTEPKSP